ncbi:hypothetical protein KKC44_04550 [Patescibacteria group bacterium]|nr:hypothetical protein [Patescibacteria group bacterium]
MKCNNNVALAALFGIVAGVLLGAGTAQYAQLMAFQAMDPSAAMELEGVDHYSTGVIRERSDIGTYQLLAPRRIEIPLYLGNRSTRAAAPSYEMPEHCEGYSGPRLVKCIVEFRDNDTIYQSWGSYR